MLNYFNYFNLSLVLDDKKGNSLFASNYILEIQGDVKEVAKLLTEHYNNVYDIKSNEYSSHYLNNTLFVKNFKLDCNSLNIDSNFNKLQKEFEKQIKKYILL